MCVAARQYGLYDFYHKEVNGYACLPGTHRRHAHTHTRTHADTRERACVVPEPRMCVYASIFEQTISTHMTVCVSVLGACMQSVFNNIKGFNRPTADMHRNIRLFMCMRCFSVACSRVCVRVCHVLAEPRIYRAPPPPAVRANARALIHASLCACTESAAWESVSVSNRINGEKLILFCARKTHTHIRSHVCIVCAYTIFLYLGCMNAWAHTLTHAHTHTQHRTLSL